MSVRDQILEIFFRTREDSSLPWEEKDFMEFLMKPQGKATDSFFNGTRSRNKFLEQIQMRFAVCFPDAFYEKKWDLNKLVEYIETRAAKPVVNLKIAQKRLQGAKYADINLLIFVNVLLLICVGAIPVPYNWLCSLLPLILDVYIVWFKIVDVRYHKALIARIRNTSVDTGQPK